MKAFSFLLSFNSKLVRLKAILAQHGTLHPYTRFNSKLVRLKVMSLCRYGGRTKFQFQTGAIKRTFPLVASPGSGELFQFQTGAIKRLGRVASCAFRGSFNSKLVRLKERAAVPIGGVINVSIPNWCD